MGRASFKTQSGFAMKMGATTARAAKHAVSNNNKRRTGWPDTALSAAYLKALPRWCWAHRHDADARVVLPVGSVDVAELAQVLQALLRASINKETAG
jgi:hypothetical protein